MELQKPVGNTCSASREEDPSTDTSRANDVISDEVPAHAIRFARNGGHVPMRLALANKHLARESSNNSLQPLMSAAAEEMETLCAQSGHTYTGPAIVTDAALKLKPKSETEDVTVNIETPKGEEAEQNSDQASNASSPALMHFVKQIDTSLRDFCHRNSSRIRMFMYVMACVLYMIYLTCALVYDARQATPLVTLTLIGVFLYLHELIARKCGPKIQATCAQPALEFVKSKWSCCKWLFLSLVLLSVVLYLAITVGKARKQLVSLAGYFTFILFLFIFSKYPAQVQLRPVLWGLGLQFILGVIILRTSWGLYGFQFLGIKMQQFFSFADVGAEFVFGPSYEDHFFAFKVLPVIVFFSCVISTLYYLGVMQYIIMRIAWLMQITMKTAATESLIAASNIFVGQTEAPILVRPFIEQMTVSELHAMMTAGFATIAGGVLAAYILFGVPAEHLLCASVMNAPTALAVSKLFYPETEHSGLSQRVLMNERTERNLLEAASAGASASIKLVANIAANLIAFLALLAFVNALFSWAGAFVGHPEISFQWLCSYLFMPVALLMGVDWSDCGHVAELLGMKTFLNEFVAYEELSKLIKNRLACTQPAISVRSETLVAYALCGFANLSSIGIQLGGIGPMAPSRRSDLAKIAVRALIAGTLTCFITACVAGILTEEQEFTGCENINVIAENVTLDVTTVSGM